ncbi:hypothetical protein DXU77_03875 [Pseudomonas lactis]|nr:hypothetical protein [Pseudomonas lactis]
MLAKNVNDNARFLNERGVCEFFASKLAPTFFVCGAWGCSNNHQLPCAAPPPSLQLRPLPSWQAPMCLPYGKIHKCHSLLV